MSARLNNTNTGVDYLTAINAHATDLEALQAQIASFTRPIGVYQAPAANPFTYGAVSAPWATATSQGRVNVSTANYSFTKFFGVFKVSATQYVAIVDATATSSGPHVLSAYLINYNTSTKAITLAATVVVTSVNSLQGFCVLAAVALSSTVLRVVYTYGGNSYQTVNNGPISSGVTYSDITVGASSLSVATSSPGTLPYEFTSLGTGGYYGSYASNNCNGSLCGTSSAFTFVPTALATTVTTGFSTANSLYGPEFAYAFTVSGSFQSVHTAGIKNQNAPASSYSNGYARNGSHDFLGSIDATTGTQLMISCRAGTGLGLSNNNPVVTLWTGNDQGPKAIDHLFINDACTTGISVYAITPTMALIQYYNGSSYEVAVVGVQSSTTKGLYLALLVAPQSAGGFATTILGTMNYSVTDVAICSRLGVNSFLLRHIIFNAGAGTFVEGSNVPFSFGQTLDTTTFLMDGLVRLDTDVFMAYGHTGSGGSTAQVPLFEVFSLT